jgi:tetraprenyl-beta-curcumene synthase
MATWQRRAELAQGFTPAAIRYWVSVYPNVRREARHWQRRARVIAAPSLRAPALENVNDERANLEGAAAFSAFVQREFRRRVLRAQVAFQAAYDFSDTLAEQPNARPIRNARQLHLCLLDAVRQCGEYHNYFVYRDEANDCGYLAALVEAVRGSLIELPAFREVSESIWVSTVRIVGYQTLIGSHEHLSLWASTVTSREAKSMWWETAAACGSSMAVFALMSRAAGSSLEPKEATGIERAYFPWIGAVHTLLDSLVDRDEDLASGRQSLVDYYSSEEAARERLVFLVAQARRRADALPGGRGHALILAAMASSYISSMTAALVETQITRVRLTESIGEFASPTLTVFKFRHLVARIQARL